MNLDLDRLLADSIDAATDSTPERAVREVVSRAVSEPDDLRRALGEPIKAEIQRLYVSDNLTVLNVIWAPLMTLLPHNHNMWALIGVYCGRENNIFWRRHDEGEGAVIEAAGAKSFGPGVANPLGRDIIHSVTNPTARFTGAIHVYGGNFFQEPRSEWDPEHLTERPFDPQRNMKRFEQANALWAAGQREPSPTGS